LYAMNARQNGDTALIPLLWQVICGLREGLGGRWQGRSPENVGGGGSIPSLITTLTPAFSAFRGLFFCLCQFCAVNSSDESVLSALLLRRPKRCDFGQVVQFVYGLQKDISGVAAVVYALLEYRRWRVRSTVKRMDATGLNLCVPTFALCVRGFIGLAPRIKEAEDSIFTGFDTRQVSYHQRLTDFAGALGIRNSLGKK
jgi:hypothetical protein